MKTPNTCANKASEHVGLVENGAIPAFEAELVLALVDGERGRSRHYVDELDIAVAELALDI